DAYEKRFGIRFATLTYFSKKLLDELHKADGDPTEALGNVTIASHKDKTILDDIRILSQIANSTSITITQRQRYLSALKHVYGKLPARPDEASRDKRTLCIGIEREGRILAQTMGWLPAGHNLHPHAKRIPY